MRICEIDLRSQKGFSLTELLVASVILSMVVIAAMNVYTNGQNAYNYLQGRVDNIQAARLGIDYLSRETRAALQINAATDNSLTFTGDYDGNGTSNNMAYTYNSSNKTLIRTLDGVTKVISNGVINTVSQPVFVYYDQDDIQITNPSNYIQARMIKIYLYVDANTNDKPSRAILLTTKIEFRNLHERR